MLPWLPMTAPRHTVFADLEHDAGTAVAEAFVRIAVSGGGDLDAEAHGWDGPVMLVIVERIG